MTEHTNILLLSAYAATLTMTVLFRSALPALLVLTAFVVSVIINMCPDRSISAMLFLCVITPVIQSAIIFAINENMTPEGIKTILLEMCSGNEFSFISSNGDTAQSVRRASNVFLVLAITGWYALASEVTHVTHFPIGFMMANMLSTLCIVVYTKTFGDARDVLPNGLLALCTVLLHVPISVQMRPEYEMYLTIVGTQLFVILALGAFLHNNRGNGEFYVQSALVTNESFFKKLEEYKNKSQQQLPKHTPAKPPRRSVNTNSYSAQL